MCRTAPPFPNADMSMKSCAFGHQAATPQTQWRARTAHAAAGDDEAADRSWRSNAVVAGTRSVAAMDVLLGCIAPVNFPRLKVFWVVRYLSDGTYEAVEKHRTKASAEKSM